MPGRIRRNLGLSHTRCRICGLPADHSIRATNAMAETDHIAAKGRRNVPVPNLLISEAPTILLTRVFGAQLGAIALEELAAEVREMDRKAQPLLAELTDERCQHRRVEVAREGETKSVGERIFRRKCLAGQGKVHTFRIRLSTRVVCLAGSVGQNEGGEHSPPTITLPRDFSPDPTMSRSRPIGSSRRLAAGSVQGLPKHYRSLMRLG
jgi:hypothetical protein